MQPDVAERQREASCWLARSEDGLPIYSHHQYKLLSLSPASSPGLVTERERRLLRQSVLC